jgi:hypothetical protein
MTMYKSYQLTYYKIAMPIPTPRSNGCIWGCVPPIWLQPKLEVRFVVHLTILKLALFQPKNVGLN